jgi:hypothetical protein
VTAVAAVTAVAFVLLPGGAVAPADARAVDSLLAAGRAAAAGVDQPMGPGQVIWSRTTSQNLTILTGANGSQTAYLAAPERSDAWIGRDGAMTRLDVRAGEPWYASAQDRQQALAAQVGSGLASGKSGGGTPARDVVRVGASAGSVNAPTYDFARTLPTDPAALEARIRQDTSGAGESDDVEVWVTVGDMLLSPVSPPALRSALYQVAAGLPGVEYLGPTKDRLGRSGIAVALSHGDSTHAHLREVMVFDERTGLLLQTEQRATDPVADGLPAGMAGKAVSWTLYEQSAVVDGVGLLPDGTRVSL